MTDAPICAIPNCGRRAPAHDAFCSHHRGDQRSPTEHETAREQEPPAPIADAEVAELVATLVGLTHGRKFVSIHREILAKAASTITRLAGENIVLAGQLRYVTKVNADNWERRQQAEAERDALRGEVEGWKVECRQTIEQARDLAQQHQAQLSAANARAEAAEGHLQAMLNATRNHESHIGAGPDCPLCRARRAALRADLGRRDIIQDNPNE